MTTNPSIAINLAKVRGTEVLASDTREQYRQKLARITLDSMVQFVGLLDAQGTVLEINHVALDAVGIKLSEVEGKPFWTTFWWQVSEEINAGLRECIRRAAQGEFVRWDTEIYGRAGGKETIIIDASLMPVKDDQGNVVFITAEGRDITEKKAHEREIARQREELAQLDKLKTQFFANISHEFRTPLTLMMGPLEDALAQSEGLSAADRERLELAHRNSLRLLKLVNTLLDFARIEARRIQASYELTDLSVLTAELASVFRSAVERAGMRLTIDCPPLSEGVYIDREMWEKIVLNLLSNAFKFTFQGEIAVSVRTVGAAVELTVRDTGTGIPANEIPRLFERFHRVKGARGRSWEGSGIGLALVQELVKLHGGSVRAESEVDRGTAFFVSVPLGKDHLPPDRIGGERTMASTVVGGEAYVEEALRWLPEPPEAIHDLQKARLLSVQDPRGRLDREREAPARILVADDNADMRQYVRRLLSDQYEVVAVEDGEAALRSVHERRPDLILSDVMMPRLDGFGVLQAIRSEESLRGIPVILLSARAGEESRIEGLRSGADDYLVKPFSARELLARVSSHLAIAQIRGSAAEMERKLRLDAEMLAAIVATSDDAIVSKDLNGVITTWNRGAERIFGYTAEEAVGQHITLIIPADRRSEEEHILSQVRSGERVDHFETVRRRKDGTTLDVSVTVSPLRDSTGRIIGASKVARDISKQKCAEEELRESEERLRALVNASSYVVYRVSPDWSTMRQLDGRGVISGTESSANDWLKEYIHPEDRAIVQEAIQNAIQTKSPFELEHRVQRPDGSVGWALSRAVPRVDERGEIIEWFGAASDLTLRKQAEENYRKLAENLDVEVRARTKEVEERNADILRQSDQLRELSWRLLRTQDEERRHIARELHDSAGQTLSVLGINLAQLVQKTGRSAPNLATDAEKIQETVQQLHREIRTASYLLHPPLLDESGLASALSWYTQGLSERSGLEITLDIPNKFERLPGDMELLVFRLVQECLTNVHRHSGSKTAVIRITRTEGVLSVSVEDQGKGMSPAKLEEIQSQSAGVGIRGMRERLRQFQGSMSFTSDHSGTRVLMRIPIPKGGGPTERAGIQSVQASN
jgi:PAS domain S-box-containing protein